MKDKITIVVGVYLACAFYSLEPNPTLWNEQVRLVSVLVAGMLMYLNYMIEDT